ncbi:MAG: membrane dipeptidase [Clostridiales bacterium]|nr:membrane dipeptidase [Candidatus Cacconaster stercorequi]
MISYFDAHCDTVWRCMEETHQGLRENSGHIDLRRGGVFDRYAQVFALYYDAAEAPADGLLAQCRRMYSFFRQQMAENADLITQCRTAQEIRQTTAQGKIAALLSIEGADLLLCDPDLVVMAAAWGVKLCNPVWNRANSLSGTNCEEPERGLSPRGRDFIRQLERCGIYADVSHLSDAGFWDLAAMAQRPIVASHSNSRAVCPHRRNLTDDQFRAIRDSGGVVGLNLYRPFVGGDTMDDLVRHVEHFLALGGEKTLCMGGDLDGCQELAAGMRGLEDVSSLYAALAARGYSNDLLADLFWNNLMRLF